MSTHSINPFNSSLIKRVTTTVATCIHTRTHTVQYQNKYYHVITEKKGEADDGDGGVGSQHVSISIYFNGHSMDIGTK